MDRTSVNMKKTTEVGSDKTFGRIEKHIMLLKLDVVQR